MSNNYIDQEHASYSAMLSTWNLNQKIYDNQEGIVDGSLLIQFAREETSKFNKRKDRSWMPNLAPDLANTLQGHLFKKGVSREVKDDMLQQFITKVDQSGQNIDSFMKDVYLRSFIYSVCWVVVDKPPVIVNSKAEEIEAGMPYAYILNPQSVLDWGYGTDGQLLWVKIKEAFLTNNDDPLKEHKTCNRYRIWTRTRWDLYDDEGNHQTGADHNLGRVPVIPVISSESLAHPNVGTTVFTTLARISSRFFNALSERDSILIDATFPMLLLPQHELPSQPAAEGDTSGSATQITVGTGNAITYDPESSHEPKWLSPDSLAAQIYGEIVIEMKTHMQEIARLNYTGGVSSSGVAMRFSFEKTNNSLKDKADRMRKAEQSLLEIVSLWLDKPNAADDAVIKYPDTFDLSDIDADIQRVIDVTEAAISDKFTKAYKKMSVSQLLPELSEDDKTDIFNEIDTEVVDDGNQDFENAEGDDDE